jgi:multiple sugar transport system permease protein
VRISGTPAVEGVSGSADRDGRGDTADRASGSGRGALSRENRWAWLFLAPTILGLAILSAGPILATLGISLTDWDLLTPPEWVGFDNFAALAESPRFWKAMQNTAFYTLLSVPLGMVIALAFALGLDQAIRGIAWIRTMYFLPLVTSAVAVGLVWLWIYSPQGGLLNALTGVFGIPPQRWVSDPFWAMPAVIVMSVWQGLGINIIIFLAGLQAIPKEYYDAADVDGAGHWGRFRDVTLPLLTPSLFFTGILSFIGAMQVFDQVYILARPGPPTEATITLVYYIYEEGFRFFRMGQASAAAWVLFVIAAVLTYVYFRLQQRWVHYQ